MQEEVNLPLINISRKSCKVQKSPKKIRYTDRGKMFKFKNPKETKPPNSTPHNNQCCSDPIQVNSLLGSKTPSEKNACILLRKVTIAKPSIDVLLKYNPLIARAGRWAVRPVSPPVTWAHVRHKRSTHQMVTCAHRRVSRLRGVGFFLFKHN